MPIDNALSHTEEVPLLRRFSIATFGWVMGIGGLANALFAAHTVLGVPLIASQVLLVLACGCFVVLALTHLAKLVLHFDAVQEEFMHGIKSSFFPAASVSMIVLSIGLRNYSEPTARLLWCTGSGLHLILALILIRRWLLHSQDEGVMTPAWFIPVVGNILVPVGGVPLGYVEASWFFFSIGLVLWVVFFTIALHRILFFPAMSERSIPTLFILLAPPSIGLAAYLAFNDGHIGPLADILYCVALFMAMLLVTMVRQITHGAFFMSWWAMTFPLDAWAGSCIYYAHARTGNFTTTIAIVALAMATVMVFWVLGRTIVQIVTGKAFHED